MDFGDFVCPDINFQRKKKTFIKITKLNDIIPLNIKKKE